MALRREKENKKALVTGYFSLFFFKSLYNTKQTVKETKKTKLSINNKIQSISKPFDYR